MRPFLVIFVLTLLSGAVQLTGVIYAQEKSPTADEVAAEITGDKKEPSKEVEVAKEVQIDPVNSDEKIAERLQEIMKATGWFTAPTVRVDRGVAFLAGEADTQKHQQWAEATAMATNDVVAVVNRITVAEKPLWNFAPAAESLKQLGREFTGILPLIAVAFLIAILSYFIARFAAAITRRLTSSRLGSKLLQQVAGNVVGLLILIVGVYIALRVSGLSRFAMTLLGGTGLAGLALGFAFRDIAENYLASILLSLNHPFRVGDLIEVDGSMGYVRRVTTRGTILNTLEGNEVQLPNSTVYKGKITNFTATPLSRESFAVGIGFDDSAAEAQEHIMSVLGDHNAVVNDPAPFVIVESLGAATVNLKVFYWFDQTQHSALKLKSSVIRLSKQKLTDARITMPDEARELVFPQGVPIRMLESLTARDDLAASSLNNRETSDSNRPSLSPPANENKITVESETTKGEGDLSSEQDDIMRVTTKDSNDPDEDETNLID